jgi:hypothetical protein
LEYDLFGKMVIFMAGQDRKRHSGKTISGYNEIILYDLDPVPMRV